MKKLVICFLKFWDKLLSRHAFVRFFVKETHGYCESYLLLNRKIPNSKE